jgi:small-conductance mechanosensitive channel
VYLLDLDNRFTIYGRLYQEIEQKLREVGITIPFPQRALHLRSVDQPFPTAAVPPPEEKHLRLVDEEDEQEEDYRPPDL